MPDAHTNGDRRATIIDAIGAALANASWATAENAVRRRRLATAAYDAAVAAGMRDVPDDVVAAIQQGYDEVVAERDRLRAIVDECGLCALREQEKRRDARKEREAAARAADHTNGDAR